jgi:hypothetical protein
VGPLGPVAADGPVGPAESVEVMEPTRRRDPLLIATDAGARVTRAPEPATSVELATAARGMRLKPATNEAIPPARRHDEKALGLYRPGLGGGVVGPARSR